VVLQLDTYNIIWHRGSVSFPMEKRGGRRWRRRDMNKSGKHEMITSRTVRVRDRKSKKKA
jgi:hypothetical protein